MDALVISIHLCYGDHKRVFVAGRVAESTRAIGLR